MVTLLGGYFWANVLTGWVLHGSSLHSTLGTAIFSTNISQGCSVATRLGFDGTCNYHFGGNLLLSLSVKEFRKWLAFGKVRGKSRVTHFSKHCVLCPTPCFTAEVDIGCQCSFGRLLKNGGFDDSSWVMSLSNFLAKFLRISFLFITKHFINTIFIRRRYFDVYLINKLFQYKRVYCLFEKRSWFAYRVWRNLHNSTFQTTTHNYQLFTITGTREC